MAKTLKIISIILLLMSNISVCAYSQDKKEEAGDHYRLGNIYYQQGRFKEAEECYKKALDLLKELEVSPPQPKKEEEAKKEKPRELIPIQRPLGLEQVKAVPEYIIGEDDVLLISVWQNPDLNQEAIVRPDGKISFPLIGDVAASGLTIPALDEEITRRLTEYIRFPEVSISIKKIGGSRVIVLGQILNPGVYSLTGKRTIMEAVGLAGGFTSDAVVSSTILIRGGFTAPNAQRINLSKLLKGDLRQNITLQSEDIIFVPKKFISDINYFLNQILDPISKGAYTRRELKSW